MLPYNPRFNSSHDSTSDSREAKRPKPLQRELTEPIEESQSQPCRGYSDIAMITEADAALSESQPLDYLYMDPPRTPPRSLTKLPRSPLNPVQRSPHEHWTTPTKQLQPQYSEPWIDTPIVSPEGSAEYPFPDPKPEQTFHLESPSRGPSKTNVTFASTSCTPQQSQYIRPPPRRGLSRSMSHIFTPPRLTHSPSMRQLQIAKSRSRMGIISRRHSSSSLSSPATPQPRYHLRDRSTMHSPPRFGLHQRISSRATSSASSPRRAGGKARSSFSKGAAKSAGRSKAVPKTTAKPALRRSARKAGVRL